jgi:uncharacterized metal-binding protein YceD (DUF177 family)
MMGKKDLPTLSILAEEARRSPVRVRLELDSGEREQLADENGLASVELFNLRATALGMKGRQLRVEGELKAEVTYICGVSLRPFQASLDVPFEQIFGQPKKQDEIIDLDPLDDNDIEPLVGGAASISDLAYQLFTLTLDPYPRHPDLAPPSPAHSDEYAVDDEEPASPFAVLKDLKP